MYSIATTFLMFVSSASLAGSFGDLLQSIKQKAAQVVDSVQSKPSENQSKGGVAVSPSDSYCTNLFSIASISKDTPINEALVSEEFNLSPKDFYDAVTAARDAKPGFTSYAFPSYDFYQNEFETDKIDVLYNLLLSYPSPQYAAALITEARKERNTPQYDHQAKVDAMAALAMLHFLMQDKSKSPNRWKELVTEIQKEEHYTAYVIWSRLLKSGEMGKTDTRQALSLVAKANELRSDYSREHGYRTMSKRNYQITSTQTMYEILVENPNQQIGFFKSFVEKSDAIKKSPILAPELKAKLDPGIELIEKSAKSAASKASEMLSKTTYVTLLKAEEVSMHNAMRTRTSDTTDDVNTDQRTMAAIARQLEEVDSLDDNQKIMLKDALKDAHESGDRAVAMAPTILMAAMDIMMKRGFEGMPAIIPYVKAVQTYSDNACTVISRWDNAAQVMNSPEKQDGRLAALISETGE